MPNLRSSRAIRLARAGFTLIELMAVIAIILILMTFLLPRITAAIDQAKITACRANLMELYKGLMIYDQKHGDLPTGSGVKFFAALIADGTWENTQANASRLTCPGVKPHSLAGIANTPNPEDWYKELDMVDGTFSAYAGRNTKENPMRRFPGSGHDALIADDNDPEQNHPTTTCVLWADGTVTTYELKDLYDKGILTKDEKNLVVGPDSPIDELKKLTLD